LKRGPTPAERAYSSSTAPAARTPWRQATYAVVDLELTGLDAEADEIVSFAVLTVDGGRVRLDDALYRIVRPPRMPDAATIRIHGLRRADLEDAPPLERVLDELIEALTGRVLVAHVAAIESGFLRTALRGRGLELRNPVVDTAALARELERHRRGPLARLRGKLLPARSTPAGLSELARSLGLPVHRPHHADGDALTTAQVFLALATHLDRIEPQTVGSLARLSRIRASESTGVP
jgi:DNA polymerase-3 subunit epsilon